MTDFRRYVPKLMLLTGLLTVSTAVGVMPVAPAGNYAAPAAGGSIAGSDEDEQKKTDKAAEKLYKRAVKRFEASDYAQAAVDLIVVLDFYPSYTEIDDVIFMLGNCLYEMEMYDAADRMYRYLLKAVGKTEWIASALLGLQKSAYQKRDFDQSLKFYQALEAHYARTRQIHESRYYAVQTYYQQENYDKVLDLMNHIKKKTDFYPFANYTAALSELKKKTFATPSSAFWKSPAPPGRTASSATSLTQPG